MIHWTAKNQPKHHYYTTAVVNNPSFRKFPADLRRAAIADALGIVSSFQTRYRDWQSGIRKKRSARGPSLTAVCKSYPTLYKGGQIKYIDNYFKVQLKLWDGKDWVESEPIPIKSWGKNHHLIEKNQIPSPALIGSRNKCQLSMQVLIAKVKQKSSEIVCAVDMGINNYATASIVGKDGTVKARKFINPARDIDR